MTVIHIQSLMAKSSDQTYICTGDRTKLRKKFRDNVEEDVRELGVNNWEK